MTALDALLSPRAIAIVGASPDAGKIRGRIPAAILSGGYSGPIYPVNPAHSEIQGLAAYPSVAAIGRPVDLAVITIPAERVARALEECADAGVDLLVMGAYTHSRMRQLILGGVTRHVLEEAAIPLFMAH